ncbi:MAG: acyltransferase [Methylococcaceae bacterium]|nr:acyltransferase [Methylococcaceae bacterium]
MRSKVSGSLPNSTQLDGYIDVIGTGKVEFGESCRIGRNVVIETQENGVIKLGNNVRINQGSVLVAYKEITIGNDSLVGEYCSIRDSNHGVKLNKLIRTQSHDCSPIIIKNDCWVARGVTVLKGAYLDDGCVVGANSVVTGMINKNEISVGAPAKVIKMRQ